MMCEDGMAPSRDSDYRDLYMLLFAAERYKYMYVDHSMLNKRGSKEFRSIFCAVCIGNIQEIAFFNTNVHVHQACSRALQFVPACKLILYAV